MARHILTVMTNPVAGKDQEFNDWYSNTHIQEVVEIPGFVSAQRFKLSDTQMGGENEYGYLAIYEIEADDVGIALQALKGARPNLKMTDALAEKRELWAYTQISDKVTAR